MPTYEYECSAGHRTEVFYKTFKEAQNHSECIVCSDPSHATDRGDYVIYVDELAHRVPSLPLAAHLYGNPDGYHKPSPTKRFNTKTVSQKTGNDSAVG